MDEKNRQLYESRPAWLRERVELVLQDKAVMSRLFVQMCGTPLFANVVGLMLHYVELGVRRDAEAEKETTDE